MNWKVKYSESSMQDLLDIGDYISDILLEPFTAKEQVGRIMDAVESLDNMPFRCPRYDRGKWKDSEIRFLTIDNYIILYLPDEINAIVKIVRIFYSGRNIEQLNK